MLLLLDMRQKGGRRRSQVWVHPLNQQRRRHRDYHHLIAELRLDGQWHHQYFHMSTEQMDGLLSIIGPELTYRADIESKQTPADGLR